MSLSLPPFFLNDDDPIDGDSTNAMAGGKIDEDVRICHDSGVTGRRPKACGAVKIFENGVLTCIPQQRVVGWLVFSFCVLHAVFLGLCNSWDYIILLIDQIDIIDARKWTCMHTNIHAYTHVISLSHARTRAHTHTDTHTHTHTCTYTHYSHSSYTQTCTLSLLLM